MIEDPISIGWVVLGLVFAPNLTLVIILWLLGYPGLALLAGFFALCREGGESTTTEQRVTKSTVRRLRK